MENFENFVVSFRSKMGELEHLFDAVVSQKIGKPPYEIVVGQNNSLIVRAIVDFWACPLSPEECHFLREVLKNGGGMDRNVKTSWIKGLSDAMIRQFVRSANKKFKAKNMPVKLSFADWVISIKFLGSKFGTKKQYLAQGDPLQ